MYFILLTPLSGTRYLILYLLSHKAKANLVVKMMCVELEISHCNYKFWLQVLVLVQLTAGSQPLTALDWRLAAGI